MSSYVDVWELLEERVRGGWDMLRELDVRAARLLLSLAEQPLLTFRLISVKNCVWGPVEWVGDQLTG